MATEERNHDEPEIEQRYKTKIIQFLGRTTPIILQNDNGPCPLLAICNVFLLRNNLNLNLDASEVSLQRLLSLVAEKLIDSNSNTENKEAGYLENQEKNLGDAIDLLHRLATGIDVNVQFTKIDDFEFTRECAIFDLLDIPLYHGWLVDPQDTLTAEAIGSKSYNTLMGELVALETRHSEEMHKSNIEEECIDFAAATTAALGVPSPSLSRARSFNDSPRSESDQKVRKGDLEEEAELLKALKLSNVELPKSCDESSPDETTVHIKNFETGAVTNMSEAHPGGHQQFYQPEKSITLDTNPPSSYNSGMHCSEISSLELQNGHSSSEVTSGSYLQQSSCSEPVEQVSSTALVQDQTVPLFDPQDDSSTASKDVKDGPSGDQQIQETCPQDSTSSVHPEQEDRQRPQASSSSVHPEHEDRQHSFDETAFPGTSATQTDPDLSGGTRENVEISKGDTSSLDGSEPIYEGEDRILDSGVSAYESREPMYEGEVILAEQAERGIREVHPQCDISQEKGELISNFLRNNASQLTIYGLFCLQEGLKERELCVFFRNNHFSTMFKFNGELYLLATDQGYINQPDLVWEKLNEVNGDTEFMTGNFTEFKVDNHSNETWDQQKAMASTVDYLASIDNSTSTGSTFNSDLQLAFALQQQELGDQPQRNQSSQQPSQQPSSGSHSRLVTGPQVQRTSGSHPPTSKQEAKSKDKCSVM